MMKNVVARAGFAVLFIALQVATFGATAGAQTAPQTDALSRGALNGAVSQVLVQLCGPNECRVDGINNRVETLVTKDRDTRIEARADVAYLRQDGKSVSNLAVAATSCTGCRAVAVALEAVIVSANVNVIDQILSNTVALPLNCTGCTTATYSHILIVATDQSDPRLTNAANARIRAVQKELTHLDEKLPNSQLFARIDQLVAQFDDAVTKGFQAAPRWTRVRTERREG